MTTDSATRGAELDSYEMSLAQLETVLSNIDSLDWSGATADILHRLDREINSLKDILARLRRLNPDGAACMLTSTPAAQPLAESTNRT